MSGEMLPDDLRQQAALQRLAGWGAQDTRDISPLAGPVPETNRPVPRITPAMAASADTYLQPTLNTPVAPTPNEPAGFSTSHRDVLAAFRNKITGEHGSDLYRNSLQQAADSAQRLLTPFSAEPDVTARFLRAVRHNADALRRQHEAHHNPEALALAKELQRRATEEALRALAGLSLLRQGIYSPPTFSAETQPDIPAVTIDEEQTSTRGLRRFFSRFRNRGRRVKR